MKVYIIFSLLGALAGVHVRAAPADSPPAPVGKRAGEPDVFAKFAPKVTLESQYVRAGDVKDDPRVASIQKRADYVQVARDLASATYPGAEFRVASDHYVDKHGMARVNLKQTFAGIEVARAHCNVNINRDGEVFSYGGSFYTGSVPDAGEAARLLAAPGTGPINALNELSNVLGIQVQSQDSTVTRENDNVFTIRGAEGFYDVPEAELVYVPTEDNSNVVLAWRLRFDAGHEVASVTAHVDANDSTKIIDIVKTGKNVAEFQVFPFGVKDPEDAGMRRRILREPWHLPSSPYTWLSDGTTNYTTLRGNNAVAQVNPNKDQDIETKYRPNSAELRFVYPYPIESTDPAAYRDASVTQAFYMVNKMHDIFYRLGFDEPAGNFQTNNRGQGGAEGDPVIINVQTTRERNDAEMAIREDGFSPVMTLFMFDGNPPRDPAFDSTVVVHEFAHGVNHRLVGGPASRNCFGYGYSDAIDEGTADYMAAVTSIQPHHNRESDFDMLVWAAGGTKLRAYPVSTNLERSPLTWVNASGPIGNKYFKSTFWSSVLLDMTWNIIDDLGVGDPDVLEMNNGVPMDGRYTAVMLVLEGLKNVGCNPNFLPLRDAIIDANLNLLGDDYYCRIWRAFSKRGAGPNADYRSNREDFNLPEECIRPPGA